MNAPGRPFRVLSLDGGGTWALIQAKALLALYGESARGHDVLRQFDLAIANSGGSIVLAALAADEPLTTILRLFLERSARQSIFVRRPFGALLKSLGLGPRYRAPAKLCGLRKALEPVAETPMKQWRLTNDGGREVRLVICGFDYDRLREVFFRTHAEPPDTLPGRHDEPLPRQAAVMEATFAEAVHASSSAPVSYFDAPAEWGARHARFWDGAMGGYNNPLLAGVVEAVSDPRVDRAAIRVLSLGTGSVVLPEGGSFTDNGLVLSERARGLLTDAMAAGSCILDDPPDSASYLAHVMLGGRLPARQGDVVDDGPVVRMNPLIQPVRGGGCDWTVPRGLSIDEFRALARTDMDAVADDEVQRIAKLADLWLAGNAGDAASVRNQPIRASRWLEPEIGHATFGAARATLRTSHC